MAEVRPRDVQSAEGGSAPQAVGAVQWQQMTPADAAAMLASKPSQVGIHAFNMHVMYTVRA